VATLVAILCSPWKLLRRAWYPTPSNARGRLRFYGGVLFALAFLALSAAQGQTTNYVLGTAELLVGPPAGSNSVVLAVGSQTNAWTAAPNAGWLHLNPANQNGIGSANVIFSYDANPGATRSGTLTIAGLGLTVTQAGSTYVAATPVTTLAYSEIAPIGTDGPYGLALDGAGNVYTTDGYSVSMWSAASGTTNSLNSSGLENPIQLAVDQLGNVYIADATAAAIFELPHAYVDPTARTETAAAGHDALPVVLPAVENLLPPFDPSSDQSWLTITGITNGVVSFSFAANLATNSRTAHVTLLGHSIPITQGVIGTAPILTSARTLGDGVLQFAFTNNPSATFTVLSATNLMLPLSNWTIVGAASNTGSGIFQFTSQPTTNDLQCFYRVRSP
jgi:hypothetical protein